MADTIRENIIDGNPNLNIIDVLIVTLNDEIPDILTDFPERITYVTSQFTAVVTQNTTDIKPVLKLVSFKFKKDSQFSHPLNYNRIYLTTFGNVVVGTCENELRFKFNKNIVNKIGYGNLIYKYNDYTHVNLIIDSTLVKNNVLTAIALEGGLQKVIAQNITMHDLNTQFDIPTYNYV